MSDIVLEIKNLILQTTTILVFIGARLYPRLAT